MIDVVVVQESKIWWIFTIVCVHYVFLVGRLLFFAESWESVWHVERLNLNGWKEILSAAVSPVNTRFSCPSSLVRSLKTQ